MRMFLKHSSNLILDLLPKCPRLVSVAHTHVQRRELKVYISKLTERCNTTRIHSHPPRSTDLTRRHHNETGWRIHSCRYENALTWLRTYTPLLGTSRLGLSFPVPLFPGYKIEKMGSSPALLYLLVSKDEPQVEKTGKAHFKGSPRGDTHTMPFSSSEESQTDGDQLRPIPG